MFSTQLQARRPAWNLCRRARMTRPNGVSHAMAERKRGRQRLARDTHRDRKAGGTALADDLLDRYARQGTRLIADEVPQRLDPRLATDLAPLTGQVPDEVRLHTGPMASRMARRLGARAFALPGGDVFFGQGEFRPADPEGKALLAHEMTHVAERLPGLATPRASERDGDDERAARHAESLVLAREDATSRQVDEAPAEPTDVTMPDAEGNDAGPRVVRIDKAALEERVHRLLQAALRRERERTGRH